jgi:hypothetical protein
VSHPERSEGGIPKGMPPSFIYEDPRLTTHDYPTGTSPSKYVYPSSPATKSAMKLLAS